MESGSSSSDETRNNRHEPVVIEGIANRTSFGGKPSGFGVEIEKWPHEHKPHDMTPFQPSRFGCVLFFRSHPYREPAWLRAEVGMG